MNVLIQDLADRLLENDPTLNRLAVSRVPLWTVSSQELQHLLHAVAHNTVVTQLDFWLPREQYEPVQEDSLEGSTISGDFDFSAVQDNELGMPACKGRSRAISVHDPCYLQDVFAKNTTLKSLQVGFNATEASEALLYLIQGLSANKSIESLELECTGRLDVPACEALALYLASTNSLTALVFAKLQPTTPEGFVVIAESLTANTSIETLELSQLECSLYDLHNVTVQDQDVDDGDNDWIMAWVAMFNAFGKMKSLLTLRLIDCELPILKDVGLRVSGYEAIQHLCRSQTLKCLRWIECDLTTHTVAALADGLRENHTLEVFDFRGNGLAAAHCNELAKLLRQVRRPLRKIILEENLIGDDGLKCLAELLLSKCENVNLRSNLLTKEACAELAQAMHASKCCVKVLDLSENAVGDEGACAIGKALTNDSHALSELLLDCCLISDAGIAGLVPGLSSAKSKVSSLSLAQNRIGHEGAKHIADILLSNQSLESLELASCHMTDDAVATLAKVLSRDKNTSLQRLSIGFNAFGDEGVIALGKTLSNGCRLDQLEIQFNEFGNRGLEALIHGLSENFFLRGLFILNGSTYSNPSKQSIEKMSLWLGLNRAGRRAALVDETASALWPFILERAQQLGGPTALFYLLRSRPDTILFRQF